MVAGYYRVAADPAQLRHELALSAHAAGAEDLIRAAKRLKLKARLLTGRRARRLDAVPYPALIALAAGGFAILAAAPGKGRLRLIDPLARTARDVAVRRGRGAGGRAIVLVTRRFAGAGADPATFGFRWFLPSIARYRKPLAEVLVASLFVQAFALADADLLSADRRQGAGPQELRDADGDHRRDAVRRAVRLAAAVSAGLHAQPHHQPDRRRTRPPAVSSSLPPAAVLFRDARRRPDGGAGARAGNDPQFPDRPGPDLAARPRVHLCVLRRDVHLFGEADADRGRFDSGLRRHRRADPAAAARADQREVRRRGALAAIPGGIDCRRADAEGGQRRTDDAGPMGGAPGRLCQRVVRRRRARVAGPEPHPIRQQGDDGSDPAARRRGGDRRVDDDRRADRLQHDRRPGGAAHPAAVAALAGLPAGAGLGRPAGRHPQRRRPSRRRATFSPFPRRPARSSCAASRCATAKRRPTRCATSRCRLRRAR